jgi:hypothetical protein
LIGIKNRPKFASCLKLRLVGSRTNGPAFSVHVSFGCRDLSSTLFAFGAGYLVAASLLLPKQET